MTLIVYHITEDQDVLNVIISSILINFSKDFSHSYVQTRAYFSI